MAEKNQSNLNEWVDIVDENNEMMVQATRKDIHKQVLRHRATYIIIHDGMEKILIQRRVQTKDIGSTLLDATFGGVVKSGEEVLISARREADKELGISGVPFADHGVFYFESDDCCVWGMLLSCVSHGPFALQQIEITDVYWMAAKEIQVRKSEFTPDSFHALSLWLNRREIGEGIAGTGEQKGK